MMMIDEEFCLEKIFHLIKLLQRGVSFTELTKMGYGAVLVQKCQEIRSYLYACAIREIERRSNGNRNTN